jgi:hypothetical protein
LKLWSLSQKKKLKPKKLKSWKKVELIQLT